MPEVSFPFDSRNADRLYVAEDWRRPMSKFSDTGYFVNWDDELIVRAAVPNSLNVRVGTGAAMLPDIFYQIYDAEEILPIQPNNENDPRIDRVVLRSSLASRTVTLYVKQGVPSPTPEPPELTRQNPTIIEFSLAQVRVESDAIKIVPGNITDERNETGLLGDAVHTGMMSIKGSALENANHDRFFGEFLMNGNPFKNVQRVEFSDRNGNNLFWRIEPIGDDRIEFTLVDPTRTVQETEGGPEVFAEEDFAFLNSDGIFDIDRLKGLSNEDVVALGSLGSTGFMGTGTNGIRLQYNSFSYIKVSNQFIDFFFDEDDDGQSEIVHRFAPDGSKIGGRITIDGKKYGMSPTDSPRSLVSDFIYDIEVTPGKTISLNEKYAKAVSKYAVFPSNPNIEVVKKSRFDFVVEGEGKTDFKIMGVRSGKEKQYFERMR